MLRTIALAELFLCWLAWVSVFAKARRASKGHDKVAKAPVGRLGIALQVVGFAVAMTHVRPTSLDRPTALYVAAMLFAPMAVALAYFAIRHLGKQWRIDAALRTDHELVRTGPYRLIRHPIYASMILLHLAIAAAWSQWPLPLISIPLMLLGTEVRVRTEDRLLSGHFGEEFAAFRARVPAYLPFVR